MSTTAIKKQDSQQLTADIIVVQEPRPVRAQSRNPDKPLEVEKTEENLLLADAPAERRHNSVKAKDESHERLGRMVAAQEREHAS